MDRTITVEVTAEQALPAMRKAGYIAEWDWRRAVERVLDDATAEEVVTHINDCCYDCGRVVVVDTQSREALPEHVVSRLLACAPSQLLLHELGHRLNRRDPQESADG